MCVVLPAKKSPLHRRPLLRCRCLKAVWRSTWHRWWLLLHAQDTVTSSGLLLRRRRLNVAGRDVTARLVGLLQRRGYCFSAAADFEAVRAVKERACYVAADYPCELQARDLHLMPDVRSASAA